MRHMLVGALIVACAPLRALYLVLARYASRRGRLLGVARIGFVELHSTRMLRRSHQRIPGRLACTGIASRCDAVIDANGVHRKPFIGGRPRSVYIEASIELQAMDASALTCETLILAGRDRTFPRQMDHNAAPRSGKDLAFLAESSAELIMVENLDQRHPRLTPLPTGILPRIGTGTVRLLKYSPKSVRARIPKVLSASRIRDGSQWDIRRQVRDLAASSWGEFSTVVDREVTFRQYRKMLDEFDFILCPEGGGLDPSPKAWEAMLRGCIPIIRQTPTTDAYSHLPVIFVADWTREALSREFLDSECHRIRTSFPDPWDLAQQLSAQFYKL